jgi:hypothetical protein
MTAPRLWAIGLALALVSGTGTSADRPIDSAVERQVREVLKDRAFPWYDSQKDQVKPLLPDPSSWTGWLAKRYEWFLDWLDRHFGRSTPRPGNPVSPRGIFAVLLFLAAGGVLMVILFQLWRNYLPQESTSSDQSARIGAAARVVGLAPGVAAEGIDPWAEALRLKAAGDGAGAVIWLFLDQLLSLERAGLVRLTPGRTARQYARGLDDPLLAAGLRTTLGVFEEVYYGRKIPGTAELDRVWAGAETFRSHLRALQGA